MQLRGLGVVCCTDAQRADPNMLSSGVDEMLHLVSNPSVTCDPGCATSAGTITYGGVVGGNTGQIIPGVSNAALALGGLAAVMFMVVMASR